MYGSNSLVDEVSGSLSDVWGGVIGFLPKFIIALVIFIIGWIVGSILARVVAQFFRAIKLDNMLKSVGTDVVMERAGFNLDTGKFFGTLVKWFFVVVFLVAAINVLGLTQVNLFLQDVVLGFLPRVIVAALLLVVGALVAHALQQIVSGGAKAVAAPGARFAAERIRHAVEAGVIKAYDAEVKITVSLGVATYPEDGTRIEELTDKADWALYRAKREGRNRICVFGIYD